MTYKEARQLDEFMREKTSIQPPEHSTLRHILPTFPRGIPRLVEIQPELAEALLHTQRRNRPRYKANFKRLRDAITAGEWKVTGETIIFDDEGHLIDGQHRLLACIASGKAIKTYVVYGAIDEQAQWVIDTGIARTPGDLIHLLGKSDCHHHAATLRWVYRLRNNMMVFESQKMSRDVLMDLAQTEPIPIDILHMGRKVGKLIRPSLAAALCYEMSLRDPRLAQELFEGIAFGNAMPGSTGHNLREELLKNLQHRAKLSETHIAAMVIKAWNAMKKHRTIRVFKWYALRDGLPRPFPTIE